MIKCAIKLNLYKKLKEVIYMKLPLGHKDHDTKVARLLRSIYGLRQSGCNWNNEI